MENFVLKKTILVALLSATPLISFAQNWVFVTGNSNAADFYVDADSIKKIGANRRVWVLQDLKKRTVNGSLSAKLLREIDCNEEKIRSLQFTFYAENMLKGEMMNTVTRTGEWEFVSPDSMNKDVLDAVCKK